MAGVLRRSGAFGAFVGDAPLVVRSHCTYRGRTNAQRVRVARGRRVGLMGRARSRSSLVRAWFVALCAACLVAVALPLQLAGATGGGRDPGPGGDPTCLPDDLSCAPGGGGTGSGAAPSSDLSITKTVAGPPTVTGANMLFNIAVENLGPDAASPSGSQP